MNKNIRNFIKKVESLADILEEHSECFDTFNYKLYGLSYDLYINNDKPIIKALYQDSFYEYCDDMYKMFKEDYSFQFGNSSVKIENIGDTSARFLSTDILKNDGQGRFEMSYYENDFANLLYKYDFYYIHDCIRALLKDLKENKIYSILRYCIENNVCLENLFDDIETIKNELYEIIKVYHYIIRYKKWTDNINNFLWDAYNNDNFKISKDLNNQIVPDSFIEYIYNHTDCIIKRAGKYYKIYWSYAKQPITVIVNNNIIK